nr:DNA-directed RNA polymerase II subunit 1 [Tanacetum cinerariifolium]
MLAKDGVKTVKKGYGGCGSLQPTITIDGMIMVSEYKLPKKKIIDLQQLLPEPTERKQQLSVEMVLSLLKRISDNDCLLLCLDPKYARLDWMILQVLPIPPPLVRPSVMMDTLTRCEATRHLGCPIKSICIRLKAKKGRIRGNLMGKHVDFLVRTVITSDLTINIDQLGVPWSIALNLTYPETVTPYNKERLEDLVVNGPHPPLGKPKAKYIIRDDGQRLDLHYLNGDHHLELGYKACSLVVEQHMIDGDLLNLLFTSPYNANFDGDEMNMYVPQSCQTRADILELMMVPKRIVSPHANLPVMGIMQDTLLGCRKITKRDTIIEKINLIRIAAWHSETKTGYLTPGDTQVRIEKGENIEGKRIPFGFIDQTLHHLTKDDYGLESRGEGLIDTVVKTSKTGYIQKRLVKAMKDIMVKYDGTVRNSLGDVIQFLYGMDAVWIESQKLDSLKEHVDDIKTIREIHNVFKVEAQRLEDDRNAQKTFKLDSRQTSDMHPLEIVGAVDKLQEHLRVIHGDDLLSIKAQKNATLLFNIHLYSTFASKRVLNEYKLTRAEFEWVISEIELRFLQSLVASREMIGCVAAQSIGEPATQMTPNTFHYACVIAKNVTLCQTKDQAKIVQCALEYITLRCVTEAIKVWYDLNPMNTIIKEDIDYVKSYYEMLDEEIDMDKISPWLLRIELNREMMVDKKLGMADITRRLISSLMQGDAAKDDVFLKKIKSSWLLEMPLRGLYDINKVLIKSGKANKFDKNEGFKPEVKWMLDIEEAAQRALLDELQVVISFDGLYVNYRNDIIRMMRCSSEETVEILVNLAPLGTGECDLLLNEKMLDQALDVQLSSYMKYDPDTGMTPRHISPII